MAETEIPIRNHALNLMELCQMGGIQIFISEDAIDGEQLGGFEPLLGQFVEHPGRPIKYDSTRRWCGSS